MALETKKVPQRWFIRDCCRRGFRWPRYVALANGRGYAVSAPRWKFDLGTYGFLSCFFTASLGCVLHERKISLASN